jgi:hypothetical protein
LFCIIFLSLLIVSSGEPNELGEVELKIVTPRKIDLRQPSPRQEEPRVTTPRKDELKVTTPRKEQEPKVVTPRKEEPSQPQQAPTQQLLGSSGSGETVAKEKEPVVTILSTSTDKPEKDKPEKDKKSSRSLIRKATLSLGFGSDKDKDSPKKNKPEKLKGEVCIEWCFF